MFAVRCWVKFDDDWRNRDEAIFRAAGRVSDFAGTSVGDEDKERQHGWDVEVFTEAVTMREALAKIPGVHATIREE